MENYPLYVGGEFVHSDKHLEVSNPHNGRIIAKISLAGNEELEMAIKKAELLKPVMKNLTSWQKYDILMKMGHMLESKKQFFAEILSAESAKPIKYAIGEVDRAIVTLYAAAEEAKRLPKEFLDLDWTAAGNGREGLVRYFPVGIVAGITPFNFPLNLAIHKIAPAIAAGCPVILKPSSSTPLSMLEFARIADESGLPKGALSVIPMDRSLAHRLVTDERIALITFTGSPAVGWEIKNDCGKKRVTLELGGNAGVVITDSADISNAVSRCLMGAFSYSGQVCIHTQRIFVQRSVFGQFRDAFVNATANLKYGDPSEMSTDISAMIDEDNALRVENWVKEAVMEGAEVLTGATRTSAYYEPTIITNTNRGMKVSCCEVFGPVVTLEAYDQFSEAVNIINDSDFGLQAGVFTNKIDEMNYAFREIEAGGIIINDVPTFRVDHMPYGGIKNSGFGREGVKYAIFEMLEPRLMVKNF